MVIIFFDHLNTNDWERDFNFVKEVGKKTLEAITEIIETHKEKKRTKEEKEKTLQPGEGK